ncbi:hypothetical protein FQZ97_1162640 [compost metagenome]
MFAPATMRVPGIVNVLSLSVPKAAEVASVQLALTGRLGHPARARSVMVTGTPAVPVMESSPMPSAPLTTVMASRDALRPVSANSNTCVPVTLLRTFL